MTEGKAESAGAVRLRSARGIRAELDYLLPIGAAEVGPRVAEWFTAALEVLAGEFVSVADGSVSDGLLPAAADPSAYIGSRNCSLLVIRQEERRLSKSLWKWSAKKWERFLAESGDLSVEMSAKFSTVGPHGAPSLSISAYRPRPKESRQWLRLDATYVVGSIGDSPAIPDEVPERWRQFLVAQAERFPSAFGYLADDVISAGTRTPLEARTQQFPDQTLPLADSLVRGYSWVTVISAGVLERLGGIDAVRATAAFADVTVLSSGGAVLQATPGLAGCRGTTSYDASRTT